MWASNIRNWAAVWALQSSKNAARRSMVIDQPGCHEVASKTAFSFGKLAAHASVASPTRKSAQSTLSNEAQQ